MVPTTSHSLLLTGPRQLEWVEQPLPTLGPHDLLVRTTAGAISIGSELPRYLGVARQAGPPTYPLMTGYESLGVVVAGGNQVQGVAVGDRVVAFYGHRTHAVVARDSLVVVPAGVSDEVALLVILTCDVAKGIGKARPWIGEPALVTGAGAIGLLTVWMLRRLGATVVDVVEPHPDRQALARRLGARRALDPTEPSLDRSYAVGFECSSRNAAFALLQQRLRPQGRICLLCDGNREPLTLTPSFHEKELTVVGSSDGWDYQAHAAWYFDLPPAECAPLAQIFDLTVAHGDLATTFARLADHPASATKVLVSY